MNQDTAASSTSNTSDGACRGDESFERAWRTIHFDLERRALQLMKGDRPAAEELVADTALKTLLYMRRMPARIRNPEGFMFIVLNHVFLDSVRHADRERRVMRPAPDLDEDHSPEVAARSPTPSRVLELNETLSSIAATVDELSAEKRQLFALKFEQELPYAAIAGELHINEGLARKRVELLRRTLRQAAEEGVRRQRSHRCDR